VSRLSRRTTVSTVAIGLGPSSFSYGVVAAVAAAAAAADSGDNPVRGCVAVCSARRTTVVPSRQVTAIKC